jgi:hypothetical protein
MACKEQVQREERRRKRSEAHEQEEMHHEQQRREREQQLGELEEVEKEVIAWAKQMREVAREVYKEHLPSPSDHLCQLAETFLEATYQQTKVFMSPLFIVGRWLC